MDTVWALPPPQESQAGHLVCHLEVLHLHSFITSFSPPRREVTHCPHLAVEKAEAQRE